MKKRGEIQVPSPICVPCFDFTPDEYQRERRTIIIVPFVLEEIKERTIQISWACSRGMYCHDKECRYSKGKEG